LTFGATGSAVNNYKISNSATGLSPVISVEGDDTDISIGFLPKGAGGVSFIAPLSVTGNISVTGTVDGVDVAAHDASTTAHGATGANVGTTNTQTLTNKTIDADNNTITNIGNTELETAHKTDVKGFYIANPVAGDEAYIGEVHSAVTAVEAAGETDTGTVVFNIERRAYGSGFSAGTDILSSDLTATTSRVTTTSFAASGAIATDQYLWATVTSVTSSPTEFIGSLEYTID